MRKLRKGSEYRGLSLKSKEVLEKCINSRRRIFLLLSQRTPISTSICSSGESDMFKEEKPNSGKQDTASNASKGCIPPPFGQKGGGGGGTLGRLGRIQGKKKKRQKI
mgnify:CR=1 FL=1